MKFLKVLCEQTAKDSSMISKQFVTETTRGFKNLFMHFMYEGAKINRGLKTS